MTHRATAQKDMAANSPNKLMQADLVTARTVLDAKGTCVDASAAGQGPHSAPGRFPQVPLADRQHKCPPGLRRTYV